MKTLGHQFIAKKHHGIRHQLSELKLPESKKEFCGVVEQHCTPFRAGVLFPDAGSGSGDGFRRGTAISAVYGTVRIEPAFVVRIRAQNDGFIQLAEAFSAGRGAVGKSVEKGQLLSRIADEETARELKQARADLQAAVDRAALPLASSELLKAAEDNLQRLEKVVGSGNVPAVEYEKARSEANRLRGAVETERIERDRNLRSLEETTKKLEAQMKSAEVAHPSMAFLLMSRQSMANSFPTATSFSQFLHGRIIFAAK